MLATQILRGLEEGTHASPCFMMVCDRYMLLIAFVLSLLNIIVKIIYK